MKRELKKVVMFTSLVVLVFGFTACGTTENDKNTNKEGSVVSKTLSDTNLATAKEAMVNDIKNYSFIAETEMMGFSTTIFGRGDLENDITYSVFEEFGMTTETYQDYGNSYEYIKVSSDNLLGGWVKTAYITSEEDSGDYLEYVNMIELMGDTEVVNESNGTRYTSSVDLDKISEAMDESDVVDMDIFDENSTIEVFVNYNNEIESVEINTVSLDMPVRIKVTFSNINTSGSIEIPEEAKNSSNSVTIVD